MTCDVCCVASDVACNQNMLAHPRTAPPSHHPPLPPPHPSSPPQTHPPPPQRAAAAASCHATARFQLISKTRAGGEMTEAAAALPRTEFPALKGLMVSPSCSCCALYLGTLLHFFIAGTCMSAPLEHVIDTVENSSNLQHQCKNQSRTKQQLSPLPPMSPTRLQLHRSKGMRSRSRSTCGAVGG